jgi:hypothetical protein
MPVAKVACLPTVVWIEDPVLDATFPLTIIVALPPTVNSQRHVPARSNATVALSRNESRFSEPGT